MHPTALTSPPDFSNAHRQLLLNTIPEHPRHLSSYAFDNGQGIIDLIVGGITDLTAHAGLVDRSQLVLASIRLLSIAAHPSLFLQLYVYSKAAKL
ncbi:hypothetical protein FPANT_7523 [Fusarium pseudoanthophilum]|uniref:Uncharacterized protein n=1 Tax=Fusarium pseudoanthophilum TaxID=48495 RepID=A0A8H5L6Z9_9HYPO|nr:hypothetical protein FPANT_7523 [Fusarium pseudoanthophilum]